ncbi:MAG: beta-propeller domain-containing protein [Candidatus Woesearchaeota archaeon]
MKQIKSFLDKAMVAVLLMIFIFSIVSCAIPETPITPDEDVKVKQFSSLAEIKSYIKENQDSGQGFGMGRILMKSAEMMDTMAVAESAVGASAGGAAEDYSTTNVQVEGVDEADFVKNDGKYIYMIKSDNIYYGYNEQNNDGIERYNVYIIDAYPADDAEVISKISVEGNPSQLYINGDRLVVIGSRQRQTQAENQGSEDLTEKRAADGVALESIAPDYPYYPRYTYQTFVDVYDVSDREYPELVDSIMFDGSYVNSRMIGDYVYPIVRENIQYDNIVLPMIYEGEVAMEIQASDIGYIPYPDYSYTYTHIAAIDITGNVDVNDKVYLLGNSMEMFVSLDNIYLTHEKRISYYQQQENMMEKVFAATLPGYVSNEIKDLMESDDSLLDKNQKMGEILNKYLDGLSKEEREELEDDMAEKMQEIEIEMQKESQKTFIHKISIDGDKIKYIGTGNVPGMILNQFSMDEYKGNFRIATTISGYSNNRDTSTNNMYVLDEDLERLGEIEEIAPGESIYSVRFMGDRAYMVTFKHVDPLFVIDLSDPTDPEILGKLKIPGYSDYLHPYDENHLIGIGKEVDESIDADKVHTEGAVYYTAIQGVKLAIFDVSDVSNPIEMYKEVIGDRGTESLATSEHKAFLFDRKKELLVVPMTVAELKEGQPKSMQGDFVFDGTYIYNLNLEDGFELKGRVTHIEDDSSFKKSGYYYRNYETSITRSLYMDDVLYTISNSMIKMNDLNDLDEINSVEIG